MAAGAQILCRIAVGSDKRRLMVAPTTCSPVAAGRDEVWTRRQLMFGMTNSAPARMPVGQRLVMVLSRV
jgi:hypothetical protein